MKKNIKKSKKSPLKVVELFAGVGGFRLGLESVANRKAFEVIWSNQHEPGSRRQWASEAYRCQFPDSEKSSHSDKLIEEAIAAGEVPKEFDRFIKDKNFTLRCSESSYSPETDILYKNKVYQTKQGFFLYLSLTEETMVIYYGEDQLNELTLFIRQLFKQFKNATINNK